MQQLTLDELKSTEYGILCAFADYCEMHSLRYWLGNGTLIGAVRHKGFIPWDDDIDVFMPRPDYEELKARFNSDNERYRFRDLSSDRDFYGLLFGKIIDSETVLKERDFDIPGAGVCIDVFPLDGLGNDRAKAEKILRKCKRISYLLYISMFDYERPHSPADVLRLIRLFFLKHFRGTVYNYFLKIGRNHPYETSKYVGKPSALPKHYILCERSWFDGNVSVEFEGRAFPAPIGFDEYLKTQFGDYMIPPPEEDRRTTHSFKASYKDNSLNFAYISNFYNHHQAPFCNAMHSITGGNFKFIETDTMGPKRLKMGWKPLKDVDFVVPFSDTDEGKAERLTLLSEADAILSGGDIRDHLQPSLDAGKCVLISNERIYRTKYEWYKWPVRYIRFSKKYKHYKNLYLLCSSAYTLHDYSLYGCFKGKAYKWGYFPEFRKYSVDSLLSNKNPKKILWASRFLPLKHPEYAVELARRLNEEGLDFDMDIIGNGEMEDELKSLISGYGLDSCVHMLGSMSPEEVRDNMEKAGIFLFTSNFIEGWGAVCNESMNSGCAVVASHAAGSVPFLIDSGKNGLIYRYGDFEDFYRKVKSVLTDPEYQLKLGAAAYETISDEWNAEVAAERLIKLTLCLQETGDCDLFRSGPCSKAVILKNNWFKG